MMGWELRGLLTKDLYITLQTCVMKISTMFALAPPPLLSLDSRDHCQELNVDDFER